MNVSDFRWRKQQEDWWSVSGIFRRFMYSKVFLPRWHEGSTQRRGKHPHCSCTLTWFDFAYFVALFQNDVVLRKWFIAGLDAPYQEEQWQIQSDIHVEYTWQMLQLKRHVRITNVSGTVDLSTSSPCKKPGPRTQFTLNDEMVQRLRRHGNWINNISDEGIYRIQEGNNDYWIWQHNITNCLCRLKNRYENERLNLE